MIFSRLSFFGKKITPHKEANSHQGVETGSGQLPVDLFGMFVGCEIKGAASPGIQVLKRSTLPLPIKEIASSDAIAAILNLGPHYYQLIRIGVRHGLEQSGI